MFTASCGWLLQTFSPFPAPHLRPPGPPGPVRWQLLRFSPTSLVSQPPSPHFGASFSGRSRSLPRAEGRAKRVVCRAHPAEIDGFFRAEKIGVKMHYQEDVQLLATVVSSPTPSILSDLFF